MLLSAVGLCNTEDVRAAGIRGVTSQNRTYFTKPKPKILFRKISSHPLLMPLKFLNLPCQTICSKCKEDRDQNKGLSRQIFAGEYHSAFKGREWLSARSGNTGTVMMSEYGLERHCQKDAPYIKVFERRTRVDRCASCGCQRIALVRNPEKLKKKRSFGRGGRAQLFGVH